MMSEFIPLAFGVKPYTEALADDLSACEDKMAETNSQVKRETLGALRALEKEIASDDWMFSKPRHSLR